MATAFRFFSLPLFGFYWEYPYYVVQWRNTCLAYIRVWVPPLALRRMKRGGKEGRKRGERHIMKWSPLFHSSPGSTALPCNTDQPNRYLLFGQALRWWWPILLWTATVIRGFGGGSNSSPSLIRRSRIHDPSKPIRLVFLDFILSPDPELISSRGQAFFAGLWCSPGAWLWIFRACMLNESHRKPCTFNKCWTKSIIFQKNSTERENCMMFCKGNVHFDSWEICIGNSTLSYHFSVH